MERMQSATHEPEEVVDDGKLVDDERLEARCDAFADDQNVIIEKRCFLLCAGENPANTAENFFSLEIKFNVFEENPKIRKTLVVEGKVKNVVLEISPKVVKSMTQLVPDYGILTKMSSVAPMKPKLPTKMRN